jgi:hypothetical protein
MIGDSIAPDVLGQPLIPVREQESLTISGQAGDGQP